MSNFIGVCHGDDVFYTVRDYVVWEQFEDPIDAEMSECMLDMWISFAANGFVYNSDCSI